MGDQIDHGKLKNISLFRDMDDSEINVVTKRVFEKEYKKGSTLFVEGMAGEVLYIVMEGSVELTKKTNGGSVKIGVMGPGDIVGEMSLIDSGLRTATGRTDTDSKLIVVTKKSFGEMLDSDPKIAAKMLMALLKIINKRLRLTDKKFEDK
jgi:CRP/FNR family transcriptional regulator